MIYINKNQSNELVFTLNEKREYSNSNFILNLYSNANKTNQDIFLANSADTSTNTTRWNQWEYTENNILQAGTFDYSVYETTGNTLTAITGLNMVESGKCVVVGSGTTIPTINNNNQIEYTFE